MKLKGKIKKRYFLFAVILIVAVIALWRTLNAPLPQYQTLIVRPGDLQQSVLATGKLDALRKVDVGAQVSGQLKTLSVNIGDKVAITVDSFAGETFKGTIVHISDEAEFTPKNVQTESGRKSTVYAVKIQVQNLDHRLKPGMPADVEFSSK